jgi:tetratricopeptide (TPR) repeat protein
MKNLVPRMVLEGIFIWMVTVAAYGQQTATIPEANIQNAVTYTDLGLAREKKGDLNGAMADFNQAIKLNPRDDAAYNARGVLRKKKGDLDGAMADYDQAIQLNPKYAFPYNNRGNVRRKKGDLNGAVADYNRAIMLKPNYPSPYKNRGVRQVYQGRRGRSVGRL